MIRELILKNRSYRKFDQKAKLDKETLEELVDLARCSPSAANLQPLKYILSWEADRNTLIFEHVAWAGYLQDWPGPAENERPTGYIIVLGDTDISKTVDCDHGIACQGNFPVSKGFEACKHLRCKGEAAAHWIRFIIQINQFLTQVHEPAALAVNRHTVNAFFFYLMSQGAISGKFLAE